MSNKILDRVWDDSSVKSSRNRLLLVSLADQANDDGICWPGLGSLTKRLACTRPTVLKGIKELESAGVIIVFERPYKSHYYIVCVGMTQEQVASAIKSVVAQTGTEPRQPVLTSKDVLTSKSVFTGLVKTPLPPLVNTPLPKPSKNHKEPLQNGSGNSLADIYSVYENNIGMLTPIISADIEAAVKDYTAGWVEDAIGIAASANKRNWRYINGILKNWHSKGRQDIRVNGNGTATAAAKAADDTGGYYV